MTIIAGFTDGTTWAIGGDSGAFEAEGTYMLTSEPKVWRAGENLIGGSGSFRVIELARKTGLKDPYALRDHLAELNINGEWNLLVVTKRFVYEIDDGLGVLRVKENYCAVGAASSVALGALAVLSADRVTSEYAVKTTLSVCGKHSTLATQPFTVLTSDKKGRR